MRAPLLLLVSLCGVFSQKSKSSKGKDCPGGLGGFDRNPCGNPVYLEAYSDFGPNCKFCVLQLVTPCVFYFRCCTYVNHLTHVLCLPGFVTLIGRTSFPPFSRKREFAYSHGVFKHDYPEHPTHDISDQYPNEDTDQVPDEVTNRDTFQSPITGTFPPSEQTTQCSSNCVSFSCTDRSADYLSDEESDQISKPRSHQ
jgi:hypothetical protein